MFLGKGVMEICSKFTGEHTCRNFISIKLQSNFFEVTLRHGWSPVNLLHIFRTRFSEREKWFLTGITCIFHWSLETQNRKQKSL